MLLLLPLRFDECSPHTDRQLFNVVILPLRFDRMLSVNDLVEQHNTETKIHCYLGLDALFAPIQEMHSRVFQISTMYRTIKMRKNKY